MRTLKDFVSESNTIEGITMVKQDEIDAHTKLLALHTVGMMDVQEFVYHVAGSSAHLRSRNGMDVRVGSHYPPRGGSHITIELNKLLGEMPHMTPYEFHHAYETLHPFMDGNGRSGRALWLRMMGGIERVPLGFLHTWYYQSLNARR